MVKKTRKIGLGVMGWATLLQKMKLSYGSPDSLHLAKVIMETISHVGREASDVIGEERGSCMDGDSPMFTRNATITTIAPTGTLATIAGVSYGVEPIFALKYQKKMVDEYHDMVDNQFIADLKKHVDGIEALDIIEEVVKTGSCQHIQSIPQQMRNIYRTASEIPWGEHVETQAAFQAYTDNAVSKTINLPEKTTKEEIGELILHAYKRGCKGLTIYRNNSRKNEAVSIGTKQEPLGRWLNIKPLKRPDKLYGFTERIETGCGKLYVTINFDEQGHPFEVFAETDGGGCEAFSEGVSRMISLSLRSGVDVNEIIEQLRSVKCTNFIRKAASGKIKGKSCPDVIGRALSEAVNVQMPIINNVVENIVEEERGGTVCPNCGKHMDYAEGCWSCSCGYSKCS
jgi:ribonucleoside-diphosphate reductase alpha chain